MNLDYDSEALEIAKKLEHAGNTDIKRQSKRQQQQVILEKNTPTVPLLNMEASPYCS